MRVKHKKGKKNRQNRKNGKKKQNRKNSKKKEGVMSTQVEWWGNWSEHKETMPR